MTYHKCIDCGKVLMSNLGKKRCRDCIKKHIQKKYTTEKYDDNL